MTDQILVVGNSNGGSGCPFPNDAKQRRWQEKKGLAVVRNDDGSSKGSMMAMVVAYYAGGV